MHVEKLGDEYWVIDNVTGRKLSKGFALRDSAIAEMHKIAREKKARYLF